MIGGSIILHFVEGGRQKHSVFNTNDAGRGYLGLIKNNMLVFKTRLQRELSPLSHSLADAIVIKAASESTLLVPLRLIL
jgi:hypothetical protein